MKILSALLLLVVVNSSNAASNCKEPSGTYTTKKMVINQFALNNGNPNWGDWCYEQDSAQDNALCNQELDQWNNWLSCTNQKFETSCKAWADKEGFASSEQEYNEFISMCLETNFKSLISDKCEVVSIYSELTTGLNKDVICQETARALTGSSQLEEDSKLYIEVNSRQTYKLQLNKITLSVGNKSVYKGSGVLKWNPNGQRVTLK